MFKKAFICIFGLLLLSCTKEGDTVYVVDEIEKDSRPIVWFVSKQGSLGDNGYVDAIYRGVVKGANECGMMLSLAELPTDETKIEFALNYMLEYMQNEGQARKALVVIANDNLEPLLHKFSDELLNADKVDFLLTETSDLTLPIYSIRMPQYGVYYQAGMLVSQGLPEVDSVLVVNANPDESNIRDMSRGFALGLRDGNADIFVEDTYLSQTSGGYDMADYAYRMSYGIEGKYGLVLPLCGGTCQGFYRYNRENPDQFYTLGVDSDMQRYSSRVPFSIVKHMDDAVERWIVEWSKGTELPKHQTLGLSTGFTEIVVADSYKDRLGGIVSELYQEAVEKEKEYEIQ